MTMTTMTTQEYEVTYIEHGTTDILTRAECEDRFGREEFIEVLMGCLPHIVVVEL